MRTLELIGQVEPDGRLTLQLPADIPPGVHQIVLVIDDRPAAPQEPVSLDDFPVDDYGPWPAGVSLRREDLYGEWGR